MDANSSDGVQRDYETLAAELNSLLPTAVALLDSIRSVHSERQVAQLSTQLHDKLVACQSIVASTPLLERLKYLCIACSNLDEFFEIRFAGLRQQEAFGVTQQRPDGLSAPEQIRRISATAAGLVAEYTVENHTLGTGFKLILTRILDAPDVVTTLLSETQQWVIESGKVYRVRTGS